MNRKARTLISLGIAAAFIAGGIWFLSDYHHNFASGRSAAFMPNPVWAQGAGMADIRILFWVAVTAAFVLVASGLFAEHRALIHKNGNKTSEPPGRASPR